MKVPRFLLLTLLIGIIFLVSPYSILAQVNEESKAQEILELERKLSETKSKKNTLSSQVEYLTNQIRLTTLNITNTETKIDTLEESIEDLGDKIVRLDSSLDSISRLLLERIVASYKFSAQAQSAVDSPFYLLLSSNGFDELFRKSRQLSIIEEYDTNLLLAVESSKSGFEKQKELRELKQEQLAQLQDKYNSQKQVLGSQTAAKNQLLEVTKNDEKRYQELLASARAELEAIRAIIVGGGSEEEAGEVNEGDRIASVISGASCNSSGGHLHFIVASGGNTSNPFNYLKGGIENENCSGSSCGSSDGDGFSPSGDWNWPIDPKIIFSQGYGSTWAVKNTWVGQIYSAHNGIDVKSGSSSTVKAVKAGTLYRGSYSGSGGCRLKYVKLDHKDSDLETFYLHVNY